MSRKREFDPQQALQAAIDLFWEKGYAETSVDELVSRSGVAKYGLYGAFGPKRQLFQKVLEQYAQDRRAGLQAALRRPQAALPEVREFFAALPGKLTRGARRWGCLLNNAGVELAGRDPQATEFVTGFYAELTAVMQACLERAQAQGQLTADAELAPLARYLVDEFRCVLLLARSGSSKRDLESHLQLALQALA